MMYCKPFVNKAVVGYYGRLTARTERLLQTQGFRTVRKVQLGPPQSFLSIDLEIYNEQAQLVAVLAIHAGLRERLEEIDSVGQLHVDFVVAGLSESEYCEERFEEDRITPENVIAFFHQFAFDLTRKRCGLATRFPSYRPWSPFIQQVTAYA